MRTTALPEPGRGVARPIGCAGIVLAALLLATRPAAAADDLLRMAVDLKSKFAADLDELAKWCDGHGLAEQAKKTRGWIARPDPYKLYVTVLPQEIGPPAPPAGAGEAVVEWHNRFLALRADQAKALYELARKCVRGRRASLAYELTLLAAHENPDNEAVRRIFGYQKYRGGWYTPYEIKKLRADQVWNDKFGWLPKSAVRRWEEGLRPADKGWISAADDAKAHRDIDHGWEIETEHYAIRTNHSIEAGVALGVKLERLNRVWQQMFIRYYASEAAVAGLFDGRPRPAPNDAQKFRVVYFRDRDDYNRWFRASIPNIGISVGFYSDQTSTAYFFAGAGYDERTLYHEATHQLFHQSRPVPPSVGHQANAWVIEGIAMYMETLRPEGDAYVLGGVDDVRMNAARVRLLRDKFYVPLGELTRYSMERMQQDPNVAALYSEMAGLTNFLVYYDNGRYRDALVAYLSGVYAGQGDPELLAKLTGESYATLDRQYREFIEAGAKVAAPEPPADSLR